MNDLTGHRFSLGEDKECAGIDMKMPVCRGGRPTKLTSEVAARICRALRAGVYIETAAVLAGISRSTFYYWMKRAAKSEPSIYRQFSDTVEGAMAHAEVRDVAIIAEAAKTKWRAAAWRLERRYASRWGRLRSMKSRASM